jgi:hypothetical protein
VVLRETSKREKRKMKGNLQNLNKTLEGIQITGSQPLIASCTLTQESDTIRMEIEASEGSPCGRTASLSANQVLGPIGVDVGAKPRSLSFRGTVGVGYTTPVNKEVRERTNSNFKDLTHRKEG